jgi:DNA-binding NarL/FixJ family response regulator
VVVLSGSVDDAISGEALALGATQFLHKTQDSARLGAALLRCVQGAGSSSTEPSSVQSKRLSLSPRELEILDLVLQGCSNQEIADTTGLKLGTVKNYVSGLLVVFAAPSRAKLASLFH